MSVHLTSWKYKCQSCDELQLQKPIIEKSRLICYNNKESNSCWDIGDLWQWNATFNSTHIALNLLFAGSISWRVSPRGAIFVHGRLRLGAKLACSHAKVFGHLRRQLYHPIFSLLHLWCRVWLVLTIIIVARMNKTHSISERQHTVREYNNRKCSIHHLIIN